MANLRNEVWRHREDGSSAENVWIWNVKIVLSSAKINSSWLDSQTSYVGVGWCYLLHLYFQRYETIIAFSNRVQQWWSLAMQHIQHMSCTSLSFEPTYWRIRNGFYGRRAYFLFIPPVSQAFAAESKLWFTVRFLWILKTRKNTATLFLSRGAGSWELNCLQYLLLTIDAASMLLAWSTDFYIGKLSSNDHYLVETLC